MLRRIRAACAGLFLLLASGAGQAAGLSVTPISLEFAPAVPVQALWLSNTGEQKLDAQLRAYAWTQGPAGDQLAPSRELVLSPPMVSLQPGQRQLVRVVRAGPAGTAEQAWRILVDELPVAKPQQGLNFVMQFSIPVFADTPAGAVPQTAWALQREAGRPVLVTRNNGGRRAKITELGLLDAQGRSLQQRAGLLGYVLPGAERRWPLDLEDKTNNAVEIQAQINGEAIRQKLSADSGAR
ncbi:MAG TPA: fimbria/pilus periplasmic chaperone [Solimonas sp.]